MHYAKNPGNGGNEYMARREKGFPLWLALAAPVMLAAFVVLIFLGGKDEKAAENDAVSAGIEYLEVLEQKDHAHVVRARKEIYDRKLDAQRDQLVAQLTDGSVDPFSMFKDYCIMGDSRAVGFWYHKYLDKGRCIADGGHTIRDIITNMDKLVEMNPSIIYLCYGLNDSSIGYWDTADQYVGEYMQTVRQIQSKLPDATIVVSSILPARDPAFQKSKKWYNIPDWSAALEEACEQNGILFANCDKLAQDYPNLWDPDGIHFRKEFYPYWASCLLVATLMEAQ